jgi:hypothetical protein
MFYSLAKSSVSLVCGLAAWRVLEALLGLLLHLDLALATVGRVLRFGLELDLVVLELTLLLYLVFVKFS